MALIGIANPDADFMPFFVMLLFAVAGILTITIIPHLTKKMACNCSVFANYRRIFGDVGTSGVFG